MANSIDILNDQILDKAVQKIALRAEKLEKDYKEIYVDTGQLTKLESNDNQIIYGRRGTGKTHLLNAFKEQSNDKRNSWAFYFDLRQFQDAFLAKTSPDKSIIIAIRIFQQLIKVIVADYLSIIDNLIRQDDFHNFSAKVPPDTMIEILYEIEKITEGVFEPTSSVNINEQTTTSEKDSVKTSITTKLSSQPTLAISAGNDSEESTSTEAKHAYSTEIKISFSRLAQLFDTLNGYLNIQKSSILLDEWASISLHVQPYLAEFIKRTFFPSRTISVKIACIRYLSNFSFLSDAMRVGFEVGGDIFVGIDLDDLLIFDKNPITVTEFMAKMLFQHLSKGVDHAELLRLGFLTTALEFSRYRFVNALFSEKRAFEELVKAAEGIPRDFLQIFNLAYRKAQEHTEWTSIGVPAITAAASDWYERDKLINVPVTHREALELLINECIKTKKSKAFLVKQKDTNHKVFQDLMNFRLLHLWHSGYSAKYAEAGSRYDIFAIDYGAYVNIRNTQLGREIQESMFEDIPIENEAPPSIDKRAIRHIVLDDALLQKINALVIDSIECPACHVKFDPSQKSYIIKKLCPECYEPVN